MARAKTTATSTVTPDGADSGASPHFTPFQIGPTLERIPDDVLHEILSRSRRPSCVAQISQSPIRDFLHHARPRAVADIPTFAGDWRATKTGVRVLKACPHLLPLIQTVSVVLTRFHSAEIVPAFAACLATLPNLTAIQVVHAHTQMMTAIKNGFEGKRFPSVRRISLPCSAHEIIKSCPNFEEVTCTEGNGSAVIGSLIKGNCQQVRVLKGLVKLLPNLKHINVAMSEDMTPFTSFPFLDTIEIVVNYILRQDLPLSELAACGVKDASKILKENKSQGEKTVIVTKWNDVWDYAKFKFDADEGYTIREVIKV